jgi:hypothetical protein
VKGISEPVVTYSIVGLRAAEAAQPAKV